MVRVDLGGLAGCRLTYYPLGWVAGPSSLGAEAERASKICGRNLTHYCREWHHIQGIGRIILVITRGQFKRSWSLTCMLIYSMYKCTCIIVYMHLPVYLKTESHQSFINSCVICEHTRLTCIWYCHTLIDNPIVTVHFKEIHTSKHQSDNWQVSGITNN